MEDKPESKLDGQITRREAIKAGGIAALGLVFAKPLIETIYPKPAFANYVARPTPGAENTPQPTQGPLCVPPPSGIIGWWPGDGDANDIAGTNTGIPGGNATFGAGLVDQAIDLSGASGYTRIANHPSLYTPDGFTVEAWIYPLTFGGARVIAAKWDDPTGEWSWIFKLHNDGSGRLRIEISRGDHNALGDLGGVKILPLANWSHVAASYDRQTNQLRLYVNGQTDSAGNARFSNVAINNSATDLLIGATNGTAPGEYFNGLIDEVSVYNRALADSEIQAIFNAGSFGKCKP